MVAAALVAAGERFFDVGAGMTALNLFQSGVHFGRDLIEFHAAGAGMESGFEAQAIEFFLVVEVSAGRHVMALFRAAQAGPPLVTGGIDGFGAALLQGITNDRGRRHLVGESDDDAAAFAEGVFIEEDFVLGNAFGR